MRLLSKARWVTWTWLVVWMVSGSGLLAAEPESGDGQSVVDRMGRTAKKVGEKIEQGLTKTAKKIEQKDIPGKVERKLKKAVTKTEEGLKKAGQKIDQKLSQ